MVMKKYKNKALVLGVAVNNRSVDAVLMREGEEGPEVLKTFRRSRNASFVTAELNDAALMADETTSSGDFTIQFGEGEDSATNLFLASEFDGLEPTDTTGEAGAGNDASSRNTFDFELVDILAECADAGYTELVVSFCNSALEVQAVELRIGADEGNKGEPAARGKAAKKGKARKKADKPLDHSALLERLAAQQEEKYEPDQVVFIPMTPVDEVARYLALIRKPGDLIVETVQALREEKRGVVTPMLDTEVHAYLGLSRAVDLLKNRNLLEQDAAAPADPLQDRYRTLVVRAGVEDTLVLFIEEGRLQHYESLRSITTFDAPETICSRILLLQDEYATGDVHQVLVMAEDREAALVESFSLFFPEAQVEPLWTYVPRMPETEGRLERSRVMATLAALRVLGDAFYDEVFERVNLMPARLMRRQFTMPLPWHAVAMLAVLFCTVLFFVYRYFDNEQAKAAIEDRLKVGTVAEVEADARVLQARIDSMKAATNGYLRALDVLDSLLVGSDQWSRALEKMARETAAISGGIWVESWRQEGPVLALEGNATDRRYIVELADRLDASIRSLTFSEIRDWPVYTFRMTFPMSQELPEAARYLREHVQVSVTTADAAAGASPSGGETVPPAGTMRRTALTPTP
ncbi:MAG: hypothetical protein D6746_01985 [Bacteroidetes bacterium]|nr:MAG: hypothetical protein D6746_01985 [Bacteroidota bacterium]